MAALQADALVIGSGVVGLAVTARLARAGLSVVAFERHPRFGYETSSRNSEVVHAGMYYSPDSLKARLCVAGNCSLLEWCERYDVPFARIGKYIVATNPAESAALEEILGRGERNRVSGLTWSTMGQLGRDEPNVRAVAALWSPNTAIVDSHSLMQSLEVAALDAGAVFVYGATYHSAEKAVDGYRVKFADVGGAIESIIVERVVNAAGLDADLVAQSAGIDIDAAGYRQHYVKGAYFRLTAAKPDLVNHLVYPVPHAGLTGLGIHATRDLGGGIRFGPHVERLQRREQNYSVDPALATEFAAAIARYLPVRADDLYPDQAGIRARRTVPGGGAPDFLVAEECARGLPGWVNMIGIESPGLTCCLELADYVAELLNVAGPTLGMASRALQGTARVPVFTH